MPRLEKFSEGEFLNDVERNGGQALKQDPSVNAGIEDRLCWLPVRPLAHDEPIGIVWFWVEWKRPGKGETGVMPHQAAIHRRHRKQGHIVFVFDSNRDARATIAYLMAGEYGYQPLQEYKLSD